jgi:hypothetical protein
MNAPDISKADFAALLERAESKFSAWRLKELIPERDRRIDELKNQKLSSGGRAVHARRIYRELLEREVRQRIGFYAAVAHESGNLEMLSKARLEEHRDRIMTSVGYATDTLKGDIERDVRAAGDRPESALPVGQRYIQLRAEIRDVVNAELRVLEAEGKLARRADDEVDSTRAKPANCATGGGTQAQTPNRAEFILPMLREKGWSILEWASNSDVDFHTANDYLKGATNPYASTRKKLADGLDIDVKNLPE